MVHDPVRCGVSFASVADFRAAFVAWGEGLCFVAYPDEIEDGRAVVLDVGVEERARLEIEGVVRNADFDERGNTGVVVTLSAASAEAVTRFNQSLDGGDVPEVFATTRIYKPRTVKIVGGQPQKDVADGEPLLEPGSMVDERFRIEAHLATGGMGEVYRANHVHLKRAVALKLLRRALASDPEMWARFQREAELVSQLESVNVVRVFDFGMTEGGQPYLAMEYVEGTTLDVELERGPMAPERAVAVLAQVCEGLAEAHSLGVIHRDLKPANLILGHRRDGAEVVKILDFGIARLADTSVATSTEKQKVTQMGIVVGTPAYIAPEQALAGEIDARTDIYALGCVAYELLTGSPPFLAPDLSRVIAMHLTASPSPLEVVRPELAAWPRLCAVVLRALSKERDRRFDSARQFAQLLNDALKPPAANTSGDSWSDAPVALGDEWAPTSPGTRALPTIDAPAVDVDDFFEAPTSPGFVLPPEIPLKRFLSTVVSQDVEQALLTAIPQAHSRGLFVSAEVLGVAANSAAAKACQAAMLAVVARYRGHLETNFEDGLWLGFCGGERLPAHRAARAVIAMREAVADEALRQSAPARLRAVVLAAEAQGGSEPLSRARTWAARFQAGTVVAERALAQDMGVVVEVSGTPVPEVVALTARRASTRRLSNELFGRQTVLETFERRLAGLAQGVVAPLVVRGPSGSGRTALASEIAQRARKRSMVVTVATALPGWKKEPLSAIAHLVCSACGVPFEARSRLLARALEELKLSPQLVQAVLVIAGVSQPQWSFTAGQVAHALRAVLRAGAQERPVVLLFDGLEHVDEQSLETFTELLTHPASKELTIGFTSDGTAAERLADAVVFELDTLDDSATASLVHATFGAPPGPRLSALLEGRARGLPSLMHDWLWVLDELGHLRTGPVIELVDEAPPYDDAALARARIELVPLEAARILESAACVGETFETAMLTHAWPRASQASFQQAASTRMLMAVAARRWGFTTPRLHAAALAHESPERSIIHQRLALALVEQGKLDSASVDPSEVGWHFLAAGDGLRAAALFQHAAEQAIACRQPRQAIKALKGLSDAVELATPLAAQRRVEALARAAALSVASQDASTARALVDEALRVAQAAKVESEELALSVARVLRSEARRVKAAEALSLAEVLAGSTPFKALVDVERAEAKEQEGDLVGAMIAFEAALVGADAASAVSKWHGEVDLVARLEARLGALSLQQRDIEPARRLFESSAMRWRAASYAPGEARALSNLGTACALGKDLVLAQKCFAAAAEAAGRSGDLLFQARALLQQARALKKHSPSSPGVSNIATEARRLAVMLGWEQGREDAAALLATPTPAYPSKTE